MGSIIIHLLHHTSCVMCQSCVHMVYIARPVTQSCDFDRDVEEATEQILGGSLAFRCGGPGAFRNLHTSKWLQGYTRQWDHC